MFPCACAEALLVPAVPIRLHPLHHNPAIEPLTPAGILPNSGTPFASPNPHPTDSEPRAKRRASAARASGPCADQDAAAGNPKWGLTPASPFCRNSSRLPLAFFAATNPFHTALATASRAAPGRCKSTSSPALTQARPRGANGPPCRREWNSGLSVRYSPQNRRSRPPFTQTGSRRPISPAAARPGCRPVAAEAAGADIPFPFPGSSSHNSARQSAEFRR